jgi:RNA polymerase sigma-70 factor (ECF subfamily)
VRLLLEAWSRFYGFWSGPIEAMVKSYDLERHDAEDVAQAVWVKVVRKLPAFRPDETRGGLRAWLAKVVERTVLDQWRRKGRHPALSLDRELGFRQEPASTADDPALLFERQWERELLQGVLAKLQAELSPENFRILQLCLLEGRPASEVAEEVGLTPVEVRNRSYRLRQRILAATRRYRRQETGPGGCDGIVASCKRRQPGGEKAQVHPAQGVTSGRQALRQPSPCPRPNGKQARVATVAGKTQNRPRWPAATDVYVGRVTDRGSSDTNSRPQSASTVTPARPRSWTMTSFCQIWLGGQAWAHPIPVRVRKAAPRVRPHCEQLEARLTPAVNTYTVNTTADAGQGNGLTGDLRYCITQANANPGSTIKFNIGTGGT